MHGVWIMYEECMSAYTPTAGGAPVGGRGNVMVNYCCHGNLVTTAAAGVLRTAGRALSRWSVVHRPSSKRKCCLQAAFSGCCKSKT